jgi:hypothetical protein
MKGYDCSGSVYFSKRACRPSSNDELFEVSTGLKCNKRLFDCSVVEPSGLRTLSLYRVRCVHGYRISRVSAEDFAVTPDI